MSPCLAMCCGPAKQTHAATSTHEKSTGYTTSRGTTWPQLSVDSERFPRTQEDLRRVVVFVEDGKKQELEIALDAPTPENALETGICPCCDMLPCQTADKVHEWRLTREGDKRNVVTCMVSGTVCFSLHQMCMLCNQISKSNSQLTCLCGYDE